jgi:DMSO/TMAO reductase YedYZ molybdopterin-dependent catalytic subunit/thiosulfate reductase cytochrome b subunit
VIEYDLGFPSWVRAIHWFNVLFVTLLIRSGIAILAGHPMLYWNQDCRPGSHWLKLSRKQMPEDRLWTSKDEEVGYAPWLALPGGHNLGLGRYWHFAAVHGWIYATAIYVALMLAMPPQWRRLIPSSWTIIPDAWHDFVAYITFHLPGPGTTANPAHPYNALQKLTYFGVVFALTPLQILTGVAMSPTIEGRFPWYPKLFGNRQAARSIHFLGMVAFVGFILIHMLMVLLHGFTKEMNKMVMGDEDAGWWGAAVGLAILAVVALMNGAGNLVSEAFPRFAHNLLSPLVDLPRRALLHRAISVRDYAEAEISSYFRVNGYPPTAEYAEEQGGDETYDRLRQSDFADYRLEVTGLVETPLSLSLDDLRAMRREEQITMHNCIQGWTAIGKWTGARLADVLQLSKPLPGARYLVFHSYQFHKESKARYYECIDFTQARLPQTILAYEMNGAPLPVPHGAPLRLRVEPKLGFKMVKYLRAIEIVEDYRTVGDGMGGVREDHQQYDMGAEI